MYSIKKLFTQEPAAVVAVLAQWVTVLAVANVINWSTEVIAGVQGAVLATLLLFYVRPATVSKSGLRELQNEMSGPVTAEKITGTRKRPTPKKGRSS